MLQTKLTSSDVIGYDEPETSPADLIKSLLGILLRQFPIIVGVAIIPIILGILYIYTTPPSYTAQATMVIDTRKLNMMQQQAPIYGESDISTPNVETQVEILRSENLALHVIKQLRLTEDPEFVGLGGGLVGSLLQHAARNIAPDFDSEQELTRRALNTFAANLSLRRLFASYVIEIKYRSLSPERAAQIANAIADAYIIDQLEAKYQATRRASLWLQDRIQELREQATKAERAVIDFKSKHNIVAAAGTLMNEQQLAELNREMTAARSQTSNARARLDQLESILRGEDNQMQSNATVTDTLNNPIITKLRGEYLELANREADWSVRYGRDHLAAVNLRNRMRDIRSSMREELARLAETYKSEFEISKKREESIEKNLAEAVSRSTLTNQAQVELRELESAAQTYRTLHDNFMQRYAEAVQQQSFSTSEARLISPAAPPTAKSHPRSGLIFAISTLAGIGLGLGIGVLRDLMDHVFRTSKQVEDVLRAKCVAVVPNMAGIKPASRLKDKPPASSNPQTIVRASDVTWSVVTSPFSPYSEAVRSLKLAADLSLGTKSNIIGFTSSLPGEGKSTVATSLALLCAQVGARTLLIDCDLRNPSLTRSLTPYAKKGILEVISGETSLDEAVWVDQATNMPFLPAVINRPVAHTSEIFISDAMERFFTGLRGKFDYVIVDLSPLAPVVDVRATKHFIDSYAFVVEWGRTKVDVVEHALDEARVVYDNLLGIVLNKADRRLLRRYKEYRGDYYNKKFERYVHTE